MIEIIMYTDGKKRYYLEEEKLKKKEPPPGIKKRLISLR